MFRYGSFCCHYTGGLGVVYCVADRFFYRGFTALALPAQKRAQKALPHVSTGADALVGRKVLVTETIDPTTDKGRVAVDGDVWTARSLTGEVIEKGMRVEIVSYESIILNVVVLGNDKQ